MVIGFDASRSFLKDKTGTENYSYQLLKNLAKIDTENIYLVYIGPGNSIDTPDVYMKEWFNNVILGKSLTPESRVLDAQVSPASGFRGSKAYRSQDDNFVWPSNFKFVLINWPRLWTQGGLALQTFKDNLDVLFVPAHTLPLITKPGLKKVVTVHDLGAEYLPGLHQLKQRIYLNFMTHKQVKSATKIIAVSKATKDDLIKKVGINSKKIEVIYEGVDQNLFKPTKSDVLVNSLNKFGLEKNQYFLFIGTIQPRKNLARLIEAFAKFLEVDDRRLKVEGRTLKIENGRSNKSGLSSILHPQKSIIYPPSSTIKLVLAGSKGWMSDDIYELPKKLGIEDKVKFLGRVEDKDLAALYSGALALTFPSLFEGFGLPIIEAFLCGCPVLTSSTSSMKEIAQNKAVLVNPESVEEIASGMLKLMDKNTREDLSKKGLIAVKEFSWENCARKTLNVLKEAANE